MALYFLFVDGVGIGKSTDENPFHTHCFPGFEKLFGCKLSQGFKSIQSEKQVVLPVDANLNVEGLPQSGTGQATIFCGKNMAEVVGTHFGPYPHSKTKRYLKEESLFSDCIKLGFKPHFINAYPDAFFEFAERRNRYSCTTFMTLSAGLSLNRLADIQSETAITAEIKQDYWKSKLDLPISEIDESQAAERLIAKGKSMDLVLYEYYLTDKAGHSRNQDQAYQSLQRLDKFIHHLLREIDRENSSDTLLFISDHGNIEDLSVKTHTKNPVPLGVYGVGAQFFSGVKSLINIKEAVIQYLEAMKKIS